LDTTAVSTGGGTVNVGGTVRTNGAQIDFGATTLTASSNIASNNTVAAGANINIGAITSTNSGLDNLEINAGTGGDILISGQVGATRLGLLNVANADDVTYSAAATMQVTGLTVGSTGTPVNTFLATNAAGAIDSQGAISVYTDNSTGGGATGIQFGGGANANGNTIALRSAQDVVFGGVVQSTASTLTIDGLTTGTVINVGGATAGALDMSDATVDNIGVFATVTIGQTGQNAAVNFDRVDNSTSAIDANLTVFGNGAAGVVTFADAVSTTGITGGNILVTGGAASVNLAGNLSTDGGHVTVTGGGAFVVDAAAGTTRTIDTQTSVATGGNVDLSTRSAIQGATGIGRLAIDTSATNAGGAVTLPTVTGGTGLDQLTVTTLGATTDGVVTVTDITLTGYAGNAAQLNINTAETTQGKSIVRVGSTWNLSTSTDGVNGGSVDLGASDIVPVAAGSTLSINTSHGNDGGATADTGGSVNFGRITANVTADFFNSVTINMVGDTLDGGIAGLLTFGGLTTSTISVDGLVGAQTTASIEIIGRMTMPATSLTIDTNASDAVLAVSGAIDLDQLTIINGPGALTLTTSGHNGTVARSVAAGNVRLGDVGTVTPLSSVTVDARGSTTPGTLTLVDGDASGTAVINVDGGGNVDFANAPVVVLMANTAIDTDGGNGTAGTVVFNNGGTLDGAFSLTIDATAVTTDADVTINSIVGNNVALASVTVDAADIVITRAVTTTAAQSYTSTNDADTGISISSNLTANFGLASTADILISSAKAVSQSTNIIDARAGGITVTANSDVTGGDGTVTIRDLRSTGANQLAAQGSLPGGGTPTAITVKGDSVTMTDIDAANITSTGGDVEVYAAAGDLLLGRITATGQTVFLEADAATATNSILDNNDADMNVTAANLVAGAADYIGRVADSDVIKNPGLGTTTAGDAL
jgi:hypothetical protein